MRYEIEKRHNEGGPGPVHVRKRSDAAALFFERYVWDIVRANGGLDTVWGHKAVKAARAAWIRDTDLVTVPIGATGWNATFKRMTT